MSLQYGKLQPPSGWDRFVSLEHSSKFQRVSRLGFVTAATSLTAVQPNFARCLAISWAWYAIYTFSGAFAPWRNSDRCKIHVTSKSCVLLYSVTAWHSRSRRQPNVAAWYKEWNYGTFAEGTTYIRLGGHHVGIGPHSSNNIQHKWLSKFFFIFKFNFLRCDIASTVHGPVSVCHKSAFYQNS